MAELSLESLVDLLNDCAGDQEPVETSSGLLDITFDGLGYDSLTMLNAVARLERSYQIQLGESVVSVARTPRQLMRQVNERLV